MTGPRSQSVSDRFPCETRRLAIVIDQLLYRCLCRVTDACRDPHWQAVEIRLITHSVSYNLKLSFPDKRDSVIRDTLRHPKTFKPLLMKTEKFRKSFLPYCLKHYDQHSWCELCITYKMLSQTLDISSRFFQHFCYFIVSCTNPAFLLPEQIHHYYYYYSARRRASAIQKSSKYSEKLT